MKPVRDTSCAEHSRRSARSFTATQSDLPERCDQFASPPPLADALACGEKMLSVVIPCFNEAGNIILFHARLVAVLNKIAPMFELIFVDDGSTDGSLACLKQLLKIDPRVRVLRLRRNYGKAQALREAFARVNGVVTLMMDCDLQDVPEELPKLIAKMDQEGRDYDLVNGWKKERHDPVYKTWPSKLFNAVIARYYRLPLHDCNTGYKLLKTEVARDLLLYGDQHRLLVVQAARLGYRVTECAIEHAPRYDGKSKFGHKRILTGLLDFFASILVLRYPSKPLHLFGMIGLCALLASFAFGCLGVWQSLAGGAASVYWLLAAIALSAGVQIVGVGLLAELASFFAYDGRPAVVAVVELVADEFASVGA